MIIGFGKIQDTDEDPERYREEFFQHLLDKFEGVPYTYHGIIDELDNLAELISVIAISVTQQEKEFKDIEIEESTHPDGTVGYSDRLIDNWYKKIYRPFSYRAIMIIVYSTFEKGLRDLYALLLQEKRIAKPIRNNQTLDLLKALQFLDLKKVKSYIPDAHAYNFIRNKLIHSNSYYAEGDKGFQEFQRFMKGRADVVVTALQKVQDGYTHKMQITNSSLLKSYLIFIKAVFSILVNGARQAPIIDTE